MTKTALIAAMLALSVAVPAFAQRGGRGGRGGFNQDQNNQDQQNFNGGGGGGRGRNRFNQDANGQDQGFNGGGGGRRNGFQPQDNNQGQGRQMAGQGGRGNRGNNVRRGPANFAANDLPGDYEVLNYISIFSRDRSQVIDYTQEPTEPQSAGPAPVFVGVMKDDNGMVAFLSSTNPDGASNVATLKAGETIAWNNAKVNDVTMDTLKLSTGDIHIGYNLRGEMAQPTLPQTYFQSADAMNRGNPSSAALQQQQNQQFGGGFGRRGGGFGGGGGGFGGGGRGRGFGGGGGGFGGGGGGFGGGGNFGGGNQFGTNAVEPIAAPTPIVTSDPPLPPGSADSAEARMRQRRQMQMNGN